MMVLEIKRDFMVLKNIEGTNYADFIQGNGENNNFGGGEGNDTLME